MRRQEKAMNESLLFSEAFEQDDNEDNQEGQKEREREAAVPYRDS